MRRLALLLLLLGCVSLLVQSSFATTLTFDEQALQGDNTPVGAFYAGMPGGPVFDANALILTYPNYNYTGYPYQTFPDVVYSLPGEITVNFTTSTVSNVSVYFVTPYTLTLEAFNSSGVLIDSTSGGNNYGVGGMLFLNDSGIAKLTFLGPGNFYVIDDLSYTAGGSRVPEPASLVLFGSSMLTIAGVVRRKLQG